MEHTGQYDLFGNPSPNRTEQAEVRRDTALANHERPATAAWRAQALDVVRAYLVDHEELFPPDLWDLLPEPPTDRRVLGAVIQKATRLGWMADSGTFRRSPSSNMSPKAVYRSKLYRRSAA